MAWLCVSEYFLASIWRLSLTYSQDTREREGDRCLSNENYTNIFLLLLWNCVRMCVWVCLFCGISTWFPCFCVDAFFSSIFYVAFTLASCRLFIEHAHNNLPIFPVRGIINRISPHPEWTTATPLPSAHRLPVSSWHVLLITFTVIFPPTYFSQLIALPLHGHKYMRVVFSHHPSTCLQARSLARLSLIVLMWIYRFFFVAFLDILIWKSMLLWLL